MKKALLLPIFILALSISSCSASTENTIEISYERYEELQSQISAYEEAIRYYELVCDELGIPFYEKGMDFSDRERYSILYQMIQYYEDICHEAGYPLFYEQY